MYQQQQHNAGNNEETDQELPVSSDQSGGSALDVVQLNGSHWKMDQVRDLTNLQLFQVYS